MLAYHHVSFCSADGHTGPARHLKFLRQCTPGQRRYPWLSAAAGACTFTQQACEPAAMRHSMYRIAWQDRLASEIGKINTNPLVKSSLAHPKTSNQDMQRQQIKQSVRWLTQLEHPVSFSAHNQALPRGCGSKCAVRLKSLVRPPGLIAPRVSGSTRRPKPCSDPWTPPRRGACRCTLKQNRIITRSPHSINRHQHIPACPHPQQLAQDSESYNGVTQQPSTPRNTHGFNEHYICSPHYI